MASPYGRSHFSLCACLAPSGRCGFAADG
jgi:hypothetical protein